MQQPGTGSTVAQYQPTQKVDGTSTIVLQAITAMQQYEQKSFEELRLEDYMAGNKGTQGQQQQPSAPTSTFGGFGAAPAPSAFGQPAPAPAFGAAPASSLFGGGGGLFGAPAPAPATGGLFGSSAPAPSAFGQPAPAPSLFGAAPVGGLFGSAPAPAPSGGLFGAAPAPAFGGLAPENENTMAELFGDMCIQSKPLQTLDEFKGGVLYRSSLMPNPNGTGVVGVGYGYDRRSVKPAYYLSAKGNRHDMSGRAPMMCFNCENKDVSDDEKYHWRIQCPYAIGNPTIMLSYP
jgi:hypothetical protein